MPTGLIRRGGAYSLRRRVPKDLLAAYQGRKEIVKALGTNDREEAKRLHALAWVALDQEFAAARQRRSEDPDAHIREKLRQIAEARRHQAPVSPPSDAEIEYAQEASQFVFRQEFEEEVRYEAREQDRQKILEVLNAPDQFLTAEQQAIKDLLKDAQDAVQGANWRAERADIRDRGALAITPAKAAPTGSGGTFAVLIERWKLERSPEPKTVRAHEAVARWFEERTHVSRVESVTRAHVQTFKDALVDEGASPANIKTKLSRLRTLLAFAMARGLIQSNPAIAVEAPRTKGGKPRAPWSRDALTLLFAGPVHAEGQRPVQGRGEASYWLPLLALYTGARMEELGQLRGRDVVEVEYFVPNGGSGKAWALDISLGADGSNKLKTANSERVVPLHADLIELGFVELAKATPADGLLFPELRPNADGRLTEKWGQWFSLYRRACGINDRRIVFHGFRHTFKDMCREADISEGIQRQLMGHSGKDVADSYGQGFSVYALVQAMAKFRVPGLKLPPKPQRAA